MFGCIESLIKLSNGWIKYVKGQTREPLFTRLGLFLLNFSRTKMTKADLLFTRVGPAWILNWLEMLKYLLS